LRLLRLGGAEGRHAQTVVDRYAGSAGLILGVFLFQNGHPCGQRRGAGFGEWRVVGLATLEHGLLIRWRDSHAR
jgi:hypothetical protein